MSYNVTFRDKTSIIISNERGDKLKEILAANKPQMLDLEGNMYRSSEIVSVKQAIESNATLITDPFRQIEESKCKAQYSIQKEINHIALAEKNWAKLIQDTKWREQVRAQLWEQSDQWCDYKKGACACE